MGKFILKFNLDLIKSNSSSIIVFLIIFSVFAGLSCISASDVDSNSTVLNDAVQVNYTCDYPGVDENVPMEADSVDDINDTASDSVCDSDNTNDTDIGSDNANITPVQNVSKENTTDNDLCKRISDFMEHPIDLNITFVGDKDFIMSVKIHENPKRMYIRGDDWRISSLSHGVKLISKEKELDDSLYSEHFGGYGRVYYKFHITSDDYYVALEKCTWTLFTVAMVDTTSINGYNPKPFSFKDWLGNC